MAKLLTGTRIYGTATVDTQLFVNGTNISTSTITGALQVVGGTGIGGALYVGGGISGNLIGGSTGALIYQSNTFTTAFLTVGSSGQILTVTGGVPAWTSLSGISAGSATTASNLALGTTGQIPYQTGPGVTSFFGPGTAGNILVSNGLSAPSYNNTLTLTGTASATSTTTGALSVTGGVGVGGDLFIGGNITQVGSTHATLATTYNLINTTATTVNFAGAATAVNIGASNLGTTNVRNNLVVSGNLTIQGTTTIVDSTVTNIADPIITLGGGAGNTAPTADDNKDRGVAFKWVNNSGSTSTGFFGYKDSTGYFTYIATATITNEVVSGTKGAMDVNLAGGSAMSLVYQSSQDNTAFLAAGTSGQILQTNGTGSPPTWVSASGISAGSATYADNVRTISQNANATYYPTFVNANNASNAYMSVYTTASFAINPSTGAVGIAGGSDSASSLTVKALSTLSGVAASFQKIFTTQASGGLTNNVYVSEWRRRRATGTDWITQNVHNGIWVDASFTTPGTDTRAWWDRDPNTASQAWGDQATTWMFVNSTGLGVGTTSPQTKFVVSNAGANGLEVNPAGGISSGALLQSYNRSGATYTQMSYYGLGHTWQVGAAGSTRAVDIDSTGNVGIGTASPSAKLHVSGTGANIYVESNSGQPEIAMFAPTGQNTSQLHRIGGTLTGQQLVNASSYTINSYASLGFAIATNGTQQLRVTPAGGISFGNSDTAYGSSGQILQSNGNAAPTWVNASGLSAGIATTATQVYTVAQTANASYYPTFVSANNASATGMSVYTTSSFYINPSTGATVHSGSVLATGGLYSGATSGATRVVLSANGDLNSFYAAESTARVQLGRDVGVSGGAGLALGGSSYALIGASDTTGATLYFKLSASAGTASTSPNMTLNSTGLGIGTATPSGKLHLYQTAGGSNILTLDTNFSSGNAYAINPFITGISNGGFSIRDVTNSADRLVIQYSTGNVGVGTNSPNSKLDVRFAALSSTTQLNHILLQSLADGTNNQLGARTGITFNNRTVDYVASGGISTAGVYGVSTDNNVLARSLGLVFYTSAMDAAATEKLRITSAGGLAFGGAANYGSSGQILQSNGDAAPTWVNASSITSGATSLTNTYVGFGSGSNLLTGSGNLTWNGTTLYVNGRLQNAGGLKTYSVQTTGQGNVNAVYEIMKVSRDAVNWSSNTSYEITVYSSYYTSGGYTKWLLSYGNGDTGTLVCTYAGGGSGMLRVYLGSEVSVNANCQYKPVFVDLPPYMMCTVEVRYNTSEVASVGTINSSGQVFFSNIMTASGGTGAYHTGATNLVPNGGNVAIGNGVTVGAARLHVVAAAATGIGSVPAGTTAIMDSNTNNYLLFRNSADNGTYSGIAFQDNNIGGYVLFGNAGGGGDQLYIGGYSGGSLQAGTSDTIDRTARTTMLSWNSSGVNLNGAISFNGTSNYGSAGQILKSNGNAAPTWVDQSTLSAGSATDSTKLPLAGGTMTGNILFGDSGLTKRGIQGTVGANDFWFVGGGATASNSGWMEIATGDDAQGAGTAEPIMASQYGPGDPLTGTLVSRAFLATKNSNTTFPNNFGIGFNKTTAPYSETEPGAKLHVTTAAGTNAGIPATSGTTFNGIARFQPNYGTYGESLDFGFNVSPSYGWIQATNNANLAVNYSLALNPNGGNVGIGNSSPTSTLDIYGLQANTGATSANSPTGTLRLAYAGSPGAGTFGSSLVFTQQWYSGTPTAQVAVGQITGVKIAGDGSFGGGLAFWTSNATANSLAERLRITNNGGVSFGATGTAYGSSGQILQSNGDAAPTWVNTSGITSGATSLTNTYVGVGNASNLLSGSSSLTWNGSNLYVGGSISLLAPTGDPSPTITARVVPSGQGASNEKTELIIFHSNDNNNGSGPDQITLRAPALSFQTYDNSAVSDIANTLGYNERLYIAPGGSVGINTTSPALTSGYVGLNISNAGYTQLRVQSSASGAGIEFKPSTGKNWEFQATNNNTFIFYNRTDSVYRLAVQANGNVSIGYNNDSDQGYNLAVSGSLYVGSNTNSVAGYNLRTSGIANLSALSTTTFYPVVFPCDVFRTATRFRIQVDLNSNVPSWAIHPGGFTINLDWSSNGCGWGTVGVSRVIHNYNEAWTTQTICGGITQYTNSSYETVYLRGGGNYFWETDGSPATTPTIYTASTVVNGQTIAPISSPLNTPWAAGAGAQGFGTIYAAGEITAYFSSDKRLKENIRVIDSAMGKVEKLRGVYFDWTEENIKSRGGEDGYFVRKHDIGVIAQEVEAVLPEIVATRDDGTKVVKYEKLVALLIEAVKEQQKQINQISQALENLASK
jgi:hypothetical protein